MPLDKKAGEDRRKKINKMKNSKFENNETEIIYVVMANTTMDRVHDNYEYIYGSCDDRYTGDISEANHYETKEEAEKIILNHDFYTNGIGHLWGAQLHVVTFEKEYYIDKDDDEQISYSEIESEILFES